MNIVFSCDYFSKGMGYHENVIPKYLASLGHNVYIVSSPFQIYGDSPFYNETYLNFLGKNELNPGIEVFEGVNIIRLPKLIWWKRIKLCKNRNRTIIKLKPDIVYSYDPVSLQTAILSIVSFFFNFKFYSATHTVASVYPAYYEYDSWNFYKKLYLQLTDGFLGYITGLNVRICYAMTQDGLEISNKFFKINKNKLKLISLPIDTTIFNPFNTNDKIRQNVRMKLGSNSNEIICIYTGRLTDAKNPLCLALAINKLINMGYSYKAVFIGEGEQFESISKLKGCKVMPFIPYANLPDYYLASDIGVWPRQESLSMNDAVACGLPIIVSNKMKAIERIDGNGLTYEENNFEDLANALINLQDVAFRHKLGHFGSKKIKSKYSCELISEIYINDFKSNKHNT